MSDLVASPPSETGRATVAQVTTVHSARDVRVFDKMARSLAKAGFRVVMIHPGTESGVSDSVEFQGLGLRGGRLKRVVTGGGKAFWAGLRSGASVLHFHDPELIPVGLAWKLFGRRVVYDVHEDLPRDVKTKAWIPAPFRTLVAGLAAGLEWVAGRAFDCTVAATEAIALRFPVEHTIVCRNYPENWLPAAPFQGPWALRPDIVVYAGVLSASRGLRTMVNAMGLLPPNRDVKLWLAGLAGEPAAIAEARSLRGWDRVIYNGAVPRTEVMRILGQAKIGLCVLSPLPQFLQSMPIKLFEYMAAGVPAIVSDFPAWQAIVIETECGLLVPPDDPQALAAAIQRLLTDPGLAERLGANGRRAVKMTYNWDAEEARLVSRYRALAGGEL